MCVALVECVRVHPPHDTHTHTHTHTHIHTCTTLKHTTSTSCIPPSYQQHTTDRNITRYLSEFPSLTTQDQLSKMIAVEKTPEYLMMPPEQIKRVFRIMPGLRLIVTLRDPVDRLYVWKPSFRSCVHAFHYAYIQIEDFCHSDTFTHSLPLSST